MLIKASDKSLPDRPFAPTPPDNFRRLGRFSHGEKCAQCETTAPTSGRATSVRAVAPFEPFEAAPTHSCHCFLRRAHCGRRHVASVSGFAQAKPERAGRGGGSA